MTIVSDYLELTVKYKEQYGAKTIVLMQVGAFFEVYGLKCKDTGKILRSDLSDFASLADLSVSNKQITESGMFVMMAGFRDYSIEKYLKKLQENGYTSVVYTQDENKKNTTRSLQGIFSPGTHFSDSISDVKNTSNNIMCVWCEVQSPSILTKHSGDKLPVIHIGISVIDIYTGKVVLFEFKEPFVNSPTTYDELERFVSIYNPNEVIFVTNMEENDVDNIISFANIQCNSIHKYYSNKSVSK